METLMYLLGAGLLLFFPINLSFSCYYMLLVFFCLITSAVKTTFKDI